MTDSRPLHGGALICSQSGLGRVKRMFLWIGLGAYAAACLFCWSTDAWLPEWDSATYLLTAQSLAAGEGYRYIGRPFFLRPPAFAWLLSFFVGAQELDFRLLNMLIMAFAAASIVAVFFALRTVIRPGPALGVALLAGTSWVFANSFNQILSDFPFVFFLYLAIGMLHIAARRDSAWWPWSLGGATALGIAMSFRTAGVFLVPFTPLVAMVRFKGHRLSRALVPAALAVTLVVPWTIASRMASRSAEIPSEQLLVFDYSTAMWRRDPGDPSSPFVSVGDLLDRLGRNAPPILGDIAASFVSNRSPWVAGAIAFLLTVGFVVNVRQRPSLLDGYALLYFPLVLFYFHYKPRLLVPLAPVLFLYLGRAAQLAFKLLLGSARYRRFGPALVGAGCVLLVAINTVMISRVPRSTPTPWQREVAELTDWVRNSTPEDAVILCRQAPLMNLLAQRRAYTYRFARSPDLISKYGADYVVLDERAPTGLRRQAEARALRRWRVANKLIIQVREPTNY